MEAVYDRAQLLIERNQPNEVLSLLGPELSKDFDDPYSLELLGHAFYQMGNVGLAANLYNRAHVIRPSADVLMNLGACFKSQDKLQEARECWELALEMNPPAHKKSGLLANIAGCYTANGTPETATRYYEEALAADQNNRIAAYNMCWPYLESRNWAKGFRAYDSGFLCGTRQSRTYDQVPAVDFTKSPEEMRAQLKGKRVIVWGDQGLGDEIMAASCIPDLKKDAASVVFDCHPRLVNIFSRSFQIECHGTRKTANIEWFRNREFDISVPITTLMTIYRSKGEWPGKPYLKAQSALIEYPTKNIGVSWAGGVQSTRAHVRSMPLKTLEPLFSVPANWYSLQYHESAAGEVCRFEEATGIHIRHYPKTLLENDYDETMGLVMQMSLVITVCTTVMHLAGAMGIPCWVMTPYRAPWVMGTEGDDLPMYKSVRLYRQTKEEKDWSGVISRIRNDLQAFTKREAAE